MLALPSSSMIGRELERETLATLLAGPARIVTVVGAGGVGKTRLAREAAAAAVFCDVTAATDEGGLVDLLGRACGVTFGGIQGARATVDAIAHALARLGKACVVLDNFEQVVAAGAPLLVELARQAPAITWVVTSREPLRVPEETLLRLEPLSTTGADAGGPSLAARLFLRALGREVGEGELAIVDAIVRRLDGIPLAIELAAARGAVLALADLHDRITRSIDVVARSPHATADRHLRLTDTIRWSWNLLTGQEQRALLALSTFTGSFGLEAAEAVLGLPDAMEVVLELVDKSLVVARPTGPTTRFALLETIRAFARAEASAAPAEQALALARHTSYFLALAEARAKDDARAAVEALRPDEENLDEVVQRLLLESTNEPRASRLAVRLLVALGNVRRVRYPVARYAAELSHAIAHLERGERGAPDELSPDVLGSAMELRAFCLLELGEMEESRAHYDAALAFATQHALSRVRGRALMGLARIDANQGRWERAVEGFARARDLGKKVSDHEVTVVATAFHDLHVSELRQTTLLAERAARDFFVERGDLVQASFWECQYARGLVDYGRHEESLPVFARIIERTGTSGDLRGEALARFGLGTALLALDRDEEALASLEAAVALFELVGAKRYESYAIGFSGVAYHALGHLGAAERELGQAIARLERLGDVPNAALFRGFRAVVLAASERLFDAEADLRHAETSIHPERDVSRARAFHVQRGVLELATARRARADGDLVAAERAVASATARLAEATARRERSVGGEPAAWVDQALEPLLSARLLRRSLEAASDADEGWVFAEDARAFRRPPSPWISVERRKAVRRVLSALLEARLASAGEYLSAEVLVRAGWPDERLGNQAGRNRLYVALDALKKLGLEEVLERDPRGWRLSPISKIALGAP